MSQSLKLEQTWKNTNRGCGRRSLKVNHGFPFLKSMELLSKYLLIQREVKKDSKYGYDRQWLRSLLKDKKYAHLSTKI